MKFVKKVGPAVLAVVNYFLTHPKSRAEVIAIAGAVFAVITAAWK